MKRPLLIAAAGYAAGVLAAAAATHPWAWQCLAGAVLAAGVGFLQPGGSARWIVPLALCGALHFWLRTEPISPHDLRRWAGDPPRIASVRGRMLHTPVETAGRIGNRDYRQSRVAIEADEVRGTGGWQPARGRVLATVRDTLGPEYHGGCPVEVTGVLERPPGAAARGLFDYRRHLEWQGIHYLLRTDGPGDWSLQAGGQPPQPWPDRWRAWAQAALTRGLPDEDEPVRLMWAMVLGWKPALTDEVSEPFMRTGTMHIFAISGLHIVLIAEILVAALLVARCPRRWCGLAVVPAIWAYTAATGWQPSAVRATLMMSLVIGGWSLQRPGDPINSLAGAAFILMAWDPRQLFQVGFQLSFAVVLALAVGLPALREGWWGSAPPSAWVPPSAPSRLQSAIARTIRWIRSSSAVSLAAWMGSLPLIAHYFHLVTPICMAANLIVVPLSALALISALGSLACSAVCPVLGELFNHSGWLWMKLMADICDRLSAVPGAFFYFRSPGPIGILAAYAAMGSWILLARTPTVGWRWAAGSATAAALAVWLLPGRAGSAVEIVVPALRSGGAIWIDRAGWRRDLLVDAADASGAQAVLAPLLQSRGVNRIGPMALTHGDARHAGGAIAVWETWRPEVVWRSEIRFRSPVYREAIAWLEREKIPTCHEIVPGRGVDWQRWHPRSGDAFSRADDGVLVLVGVLHGTRVALLSDLGPKGQQALLERPGLGPVDIVIAGIPSPGEPLTDDLLAALDPQLIIVQSGDYPASERLGPAIRNRLAALGRPVVCTEEMGATTVRIRSGGRWEIETMVGKRWSGRGRADDGVGAK
ncbi:MAG: ComEC/Rec2 family competence protein [Verrucomicrobia bacterium]|nr:ComEC/Rec2 family competence protein [Verrucomicrobiota bacterium]